MPARVKILLLALTAAAIGAFVVAAQSTSSDAGCQTPDAIERIIPECGATVLQQDQVGVVLAPGYRANLAINGTTIPPDQVFSIGVEANPELGIEPDSVVFRPGSDREIEQLRPTENCVTARYWNLAGDAESGDTFTWCFRAT